MALWGLLPMKHSGSTGADQNDSRYAVSRDPRGRFAARNSIWSARMRRLRRIMSSHRLGT